MDLGSSFNDDDDSFFYGCLNKTISITTIHESLGLFSLTNNNPKKLAFYTDESDCLHKRIIQIAKSFKVPYNGNQGQLLAELAKENSFSEQLDELEVQYGHAVWGRTHDWQSQATDPFDWDREEDRKRIRFFLRCWIVGYAVRDTGTSSRKGKAKGKAKVEDDEYSDSGVPTTPLITKTSAPSDLPNSATGTRLFPIFNKSPKGVRSTPGNSGLASPNKRKSTDGNGGESSRKTPKVTKGSWTAPVDKCSGLGSPGRASSGRAHSSRRFEDQGRGEATRDTAQIFILSPEGSVESEETLDVDESIREARELFSPTFPATGAEYVHEDYEPCIAGPSGTYHNSRVQDSVIPSDTQNDPPTPTQETAEIDQAPVQYLDSEIPKRVMEPPEATLVNQYPCRERQTRRELFRLLLAYLNNIDQFHPESYDHDAEKWMNTLLSSFWLQDITSLQANVGARFTQLDLALTTWMDMRTRLAEFRIVTGYFGPPDAQWEAHLRGIQGKQDHAQACIAFAKLKDVLEEEHMKAIPHIDEVAFNEDLAMAFDLLTDVKGCNGAEAFKGLSDFNRALFEWFF
ncbi:hypothetical protein P153DRAFT_355372 [Dothidotthia symphoricarpi CBS 119687]|uniref:Uncharacterized protein n=1 Tax=Dothidotthia symphoricarpi CBS 119687 TaxID=1392245 RepID=A0A6A6AI65_9PLEO|nr:uncharacterized protein P153DRAFT_355372 [Dothidotthia symphoricarpi CBS 119687]KAF2131629.1 hypothetical protein P153DRAFT_355372 [Dothidotthia symphoricarpi CBS 119687]